MPAQLGYSAPAASLEAAERLASRIEAWACENGAELQVIRQPRSVVVMFPPQHLRAFKESWADFSLA